MAVSRSQARGFAGVTKLRKTLRRLDEESTANLKTVVKEAGATLEALVQSTAPRDEGEMAEQVGHKISADGFTVVAGVGAKHAKGFKEVKTKYVGSVAKGTRRLSKVTIRNRKARWNMYKALWHEFGTKGGTYKPKRGAAIKLHAQKASHFHQRAYDAAAPTIRRKSQHAIKKALGVAVRG